MCDNLDPNRVRCEACRTINLAKRGQEPKPDMQQYEKCTPTKRIDCGRVTELPLNPTCIKVCTKEEYEMYKRGGPKITKPLLPPYQHGKLLYLIKAGVLVGAVYFTYSQGVWGNQKDVTEAVARWSEYVRSINTRRPPFYDMCGKVITLIWRKPSFLHDQLDVISGRQTGGAVPAHCVASHSILGQLTAACEGVLNPRAYARLLKTLIWRKPSFLHDQLDVISGRQTGGAVPAHCVASHSILGQLTAACEGVLNPRAYARLLKRKENPESVVAPAYFIYKNFITTCFAGVVKLPVVVKCAYFDYLNELQRKHEIDKRERAIHRRG